MRKLVLCSFILMFLVSCSDVFSYEKEVPYLINGEMILNDSDSGSLSSFKFEMKNCSEKDIYSFTVVFFLFDEDGNPVVTGKPNITAIIRETVPAGEILSSSFSMDEFLFTLPEVPYRTEYLFVKKIIYADGTEWNDIFGLKSL